MNTLFAPFTIEDMLTLLPGLNERALKEELRRCGCFIKGSKPMLVTVDQFKRFMKMNEVQPRKPQGTEEPIGAPGFIYFVACDLPDGTAMVKIGYAKNVKTRLASLQSANALPIRLISAIPGSPAREKTIHSRFAGVRQRGEWFALTPEMEREFRGFSNG